MTIIAIGIDLAKNVFAVHGVDETGTAVLVRPNVKRDGLLELVAKQPPCVIGMEACSGAHYWARQFQAYGHTGRHTMVVTACSQRPTSQPNSSARQRWRMPRL